MEPLIAFAAVALGYLSGSLSFARIVGGIVAPGKDISRMEYKIPNHDVTIVTDAVSATTARVHLGPRYGCLISLLDMAKVAVPTLLVHLWRPDMPYDLLAATAGIVGHNWPVYHRFHGGRGESAIIGGLLVIDWMAVLVTNLIGFAVGVFVGSLLVLRWTGFFLLVPWFWIMHGDWPHILYAVGAVLLYYVAVRKDLTQYFESKKKGTFPGQEELGAFLGMGRGFGRMLDRYSIIGVINRIRGKTPGRRSVSQGDS
jgi:glycerol-3-phosphate acyltransferase PlsY